MKTVLLLAGTLAYAATAWAFPYETVVVPDKMVETDHLLLTDFTNLLTKAAGRNFAVVPYASRPAARRIFFGISPADGAAPLDDRERRIVTKDDDLYLCGGGANGTRYAVYDFLVNDLGFRFFDARGGMRVPDARNFAMPPTDRRRKHNFADRSISCIGRYTGPESALFLYRHGMNANMEWMTKREGLGPVKDDFRTPWPSDASLVTYLPRNLAAYNFAWVKKACPNLEKDHPEYFSLDKDGKRVFTHQRCLSNPDCRKLLKENFFRRLESCREPSYVDLSAGDTPGRFCHCPGCLALETKHGSNAGPLIDVFLEFCPEAAKLHPRHNLMTLAYRKEQTQHPPKNLAKMPDNFIARFAPIDDDFSKDWTHPSNRETLEDLRTWGRMCRKVLMWYYPNPYGGDLTPPLGNLERLANDIRIMKEAGTTGVTFEHNVGVTPMTGFTELQSYVMLRLFDDVSLDWRQLANEFIDFEYGAAADGVKAYLAELEELRKTTEMGFPWDAGLVYYKYLTPERLDRWERAFDVLEKKTADDPVRLGNLRRLRINLDHAALQVCKRPALAKRIREIVGEICRDCFAPKYAAEAKKFAKGIDESLQLLEIQSGASAKPLPKEIFGGIPPERLFTTLPRSYSGGKRDDPDAAFGVTVVFDGVKKPQAMKLPLQSHLETVLPKSTYSGILGRGVDRENLGPRGAYRFYEMGTATVTPDCFVELGTWWFQAKLGGAYKEGSFNKVRIYASLKFQGPKFYPEDVGKPDLILCDRVVVVRE